MPNKTIKRMGGKRLKSYKQRRTKRRRKLKGGAADSDFNPRENTVFLKPGINTDVSGEGADPGGSGSETANAELKQKQTKINEAIALLTKAVGEYEIFCRGHTEDSTEIQKFNRSATSTLTEPLRWLSLDTGTNATIPSLRTGEDVASAAAAAATASPVRRDMPLESWISPSTGKFPEWMMLGDRLAKYVLYLPPDPSNLYLTYAQRVVITKLSEQERTDILGSLPIENSKALERLIY